MKKNFLDYIMFHELLERGGKALLVNYLAAARDWKFNNGLPFAKPLPADVRFEIDMWLRKLEQPDADGSILRDATEFAKHLRYQYAEFSNFWYRQIEPDPEVK